MNFDDTPHSESDFYFSSDKKLLNHDWIFTNLLAQPWASWLDHETIVEAIRNSDCYGLYRTDGRQVGFCRVVSDRATLHYLCDVVIDPAFRKNGLGKFMIQNVLEVAHYHQGIFLLRTPDQQALYRKFRFEEVTAMRRIPTT